jgi:hypothetical protein
MNEVAVRLVAQPSLYDFFLDIANKRFRRFKVDSIIIRESFAFFVLNI